MITSQNIVEEAVADSTTGDDFDTLLAMSLATVSNTSEQTPKYREKLTSTSGRLGKHGGDSVLLLDNELNIFPEEEEGELFSDDEQKAASKHCENLSSEYNRDNSFHSSSRRLSSYRSRSGSETDSESTGFATGSNSDLQYFGKMRNSSHSNSPVKHKSKLAHRLGPSISPQSHHKSAKFRLGTKQDAIPTLESVAPIVDPTFSVPEDLSSFSVAMKTGRISTNSSRGDTTEWIKVKKAHKNKDKNAFASVMQSSTRELTTLSRAQKMKSRANKVVSKVPGDENRGAILDDSEDDERLENYLKQKSMRKVTVHASHERDISTSKERSSSLSRERSLNLHSGLEKRSQFDKKRLMKMAIQDSNREERRSHPYNAKGVKVKDTSWKNLSSSSDDDFVDPNMIKRKSLKTMKTERSPRKVSRRKRPSSKVVASKTQVRSAIVLADFTNSPSIVESGTPQVKQEADETPQTKKSPTAEEIAETAAEDQKPESPAKSEETLLPKDSIEDVSSASELEAGEEKEVENPLAVSTENSKEQCATETNSEARMPLQNEENVRDPSVSSSSSSSSDSSNDSSSDSSSSSDDEKGSKSSSSSSSSSENEGVRENGRMGSNRHQRLTITKSGGPQNANRKRHYSWRSDSDSEGGETMRCVVQRLPLEPKQVHAMRSKSPAAQSMLIPDIPRKAPSSVSDIYRLEKTRLGIGKDPPAKLVSKVGANGKGLSASLGSNEDATDKSVVSKSPSDESGTKEASNVKIEAEVLDIPKPWRKSENPAKVAKPSPPVETKKPSAVNKSESEKKHAQPAPHSSTAASVSSSVNSSFETAKRGSATTSSLSSSSVAAAVPSVSAELSTVCNTSNVYQTPILMSNPFVAVDPQQLSLVHIPIESATMDPFTLCCNMTPTPGVPLPVPAPVPPPADTVAYCDDYGNQPFYQLANHNPEHSDAELSLVASQPFYSLDPATSIQQMFPLDPPPAPPVGTNFVQSNSVWQDSLAMPHVPDFGLAAKTSSFEPPSQPFVDPSFLPTSHSMNSGTELNPIQPPKDPMFPPLLGPFTSKPEDTSSKSTVAARPPFQKPPLPWPPIPPNTTQSEQGTVVGKYLPWYDPNSGVAPSLSEMLPYFSRFWDVFMLRDVSDAKSARQVIVGLLESAIKYQESQGLRVDPQLKMVSEMMKSFKNLENI